MEPAEDLLAVDAEGYGGLRLIGVGHLHKAKPARAARVTVVGAMTAPLARTPLHDLHLRLGARIVALAQTLPEYLVPALLERLGMPFEVLSPAVDETPLAGEAPPADCDTCWLPGGYPELHAERLAHNRPFCEALRAHHAAGRPILAECGGMMVLFNTLTDSAGTAHRMAGLLPGGAVMQARLAALGGQQLALPEGTLRGHTFHYSRLDTPLAPALHANTPDGCPGEAVYRAGRLVASYVHAYFPSHPAAVAALLAP